MRTRHRLERASCCAGRSRFGKRTFDNAKWHRKQDAGEAMMDDLDALRGRLSVVRETTHVACSGSRKLRRAIIDGKLAPGARLVAAIRARDVDQVRRFSEEHVHAAAETVFTTTFGSEVTPRAAAAPPVGRRSVAPQKPRAARVTPPKPTAKAESRQDSLARQFRCDPTSSAASRGPRPDDVAAMSAGFAQIAAPGRPESAISRSRCPNFAEF